jgi:hypothetical protein
MKSFPLNKAFTFLESGPVILVSTAGGGVKHAARPRSFLSGQRLSRRGFFRYHCGELEAEYPDGFYV